jgi:MFS family permease
MTEPHDSGGGRAGGFPPERRPAVFRALRSRNYRLFFAGQLISLVGTWLSQVAMSWLVYRLTGSALLLGLVSFAGQIPGFVLAPIAGVLVDRWRLRRVLLATQALSLVQAAVLATITLAGMVDVAHLLILSILLGLINAVDLPARQAFVVQMLERREDLPNAIALNSSLVNAARVVGPSLAGILIAVMGEGMCFLVNAVSFLAVIAALAGMRVRQAARPPVANVVREFRNGFAYVRGSTAIRSILLLMALVSLAGVPYMVLMPVFARQVLHGDATTLGFLSAASGAGALAGGMTLAARRTVLGLGRWIAFAAGSFGAALIAFSFSRSLPLSLLMLPVAGFSMIVEMAASNTLLQTIVDDAMRGRVMAFFGMAFQGMMPFGSLIAGIAAHSGLGAPGTVAIGGAVCVAGALLFLRTLPAIRRQLRPLYVEKGIIRATAEE